MVSSEVHLHIDESRLIDEHRFIHLGIILVHLRIASYTK